MRLSIVSAGIVLTLLAPSAAQAKPPKPKSDQLSAISQYRETLPSAAGPVYPGAQPPAAPAPRGVRPAKGGSRLPTPVARALRRQAGADAPALKTIATSPERGAPTRPLPKLHDRSVHERATRAKPDGTAKKVEKAVFATVRAPIGDAGHGRLLWLLVVAIVIAAVAVAARWRTRLPSP